MNKVEYSIVIPCYKSSETIDFVIDDIQQSMQSMKRENYEIILVNDCSPDERKTIGKIREIANKNSCVKVIDLAKNVGQHNAMMAGLRNASGNIIIEMDDDGQTRASELPKMFKVFDEGYDVVYGCYPEKKESIFRLFGSWVNRFCAEYFLNKPKNIRSSSFWIMRKYIKDSIIEYKGPYTYLLGLILRSTDNIKSVEVNHFEREYGSSGYTFKSLLKLFSNIIGFTAKPLHLAMQMGFLFAGGSFVAVLYVLIRKLTHAGITAGWASTIIAIFFALGVILIFMGAIGEYIGRMYLQINNEPQYIVKEKIGFIEEK